MMQEAYTGQLELLDKPMANEPRASSQPFRIHHIEKSNIEGEMAT